MKFCINCERIEIVFPCEAGEWAENLGIFEKYKGKFYTLEEINKIIAEMIIRMPYVSGAMWLEFTVSCIEDEGSSSYHHMIVINNYGWEEQRKSRTKKIKFKN